MVKRSKPSNVEPKPDDGGSFNAAENIYLKAKNSELAKALTESKSNYATLFSERNYLNKELLFAHAHIKKLENYVTTIESAARSSIDAVVSSSNYITEILQTTRLMQNKTYLNDTEKSFFCGSTSHSPGTPNKTQAVKPMIDGHVIYRPTISLTRVNEGALEGFQRVRRGNQPQPERIATSAVNENDRNSTPNMDYSNHINEENIEMNTEPMDDNDASNSYDSGDHPSNNFIGEEITNNSLGPILEATEISSDHNVTRSLTAGNNSLNLSTNGSHLPILSGVFRDVRVYLSPIQNGPQLVSSPQMHISKERGSGKSKQLKSENHPTMNLENISKRNTNGLKNGVSTSNSVPSTSSADNSPRTTALQNLPLRSSVVNSSNKNGDDSTGNGSPKKWINIRNKNENSGLRSFNDKSVTPMKTNDSFTDSPSTKVQYRARNSVGISSNATSASNYDPLEGPSNLLDSLVAEIEDETKILTLGMLGLQPLKNILFGSSTPVLQTKSPKERVAKKDTHYPHDSKKTPKKLRKSTNVTKRKAIKKKKKKAKVPSAKAAKILIKEMSPNRLSDIGGSLNNSAHLMSSDSKDNVSNASSSIQLPLYGSCSTSNAPEKKEEVEQSVVDDSVETLETRNDGTPRKRGRPKRGTRPVISFKEPLLNRKLRRSK